MRRTLPHAATRCCTLRGRADRVDEELRLEQVKALMDAGSLRKLASYDQLNRERAKGEVMSARDVYDMNSWAAAADITSAHDTTRAQLHGCRGYHRH